eukprot:CAMPEP_0197029184 /NCGR_PEP_ID=MMETSP1384-20130603/8679_1 /TAXON_ID=29189 /ORGANISM="Ammonia sp." /LENGTH=474 /DNA_ID=CAMNT_0042458299 /DNA_START=39 /DNA_END=1463 /DNA_ORIENTATION=-
MKVNAANLLLTVICLNSIAKTKAASSGYATFYGGNAAGNACGFNGVATASFPYGYYAAAGGGTFDSGYGCGKCFQITCIGAYGVNPDCSCGSEPTVTVEVLDQCPECSAAHFDLNPTAMAKIVGPGLSGTCGKIEITYERVDCAYGVNFRVRNKAGTSQFWYGLHLEDIAGDGSVTSLELYKSGSKVGYCTKNNGPSFWICTASSGTFPDLPMSIKLTSDNGETVTAENCITSYTGGAEMQCNTNFGGGSSSGTTSTTSTTTTTTTTTSSGSSGQAVIVRNKDGLNQWWYAVTLENTPANGIESVKLRGAGMTSWETGVKEWDYYKFTQNKPYSPPFSFKITEAITGNTVTSYNVISSLNEGDYGTMSSSFADAYTEEDDGSGANKVGWPAVAGVVVVIAALIAIGCCVYYARKKKAEKGQVSFADNNEVEQAEKKATKTGGYDMSPVSTKEDHEEIEVEVQAQHDDVAADTVR